MKSRLSLIILTITIGALVVSCGSDDTAKTTDRASDTTPNKKTEVKERDSTAPAIKPVKPFVPGRVLLVTQSRFAPNEEGKYTVPDAAVMMVLLFDGKKWTVDTIEDKESNVFHKALQYGDEGILTIGANEAMLKLWNKKNGKWEATTLWHPTFGGKHNRLRDFESADLDGDGTKDLAIATHDQGVVAVAWRKDGEWKFEEIDRQAETFVHEIEIGDLDGNGRMEIYATPSQPNTSSGQGQGGGVLRYEWTGKKFEKSQVVHYDERHIKEILVSDMDGDGKSELYAALEAQMGKDGRIEAPVEIRRFDWNGEEFESTKVVELNDRFCRFLVAGDIDKDGANELVAAAFSSGVWVIDKKGNDYEKASIDANSGGFEHAAYMADMDGDDKLELYIANDNSGALSRYVFEQGEYKRTVINKRLVPGAAMVWNITVADLN